MLHSSVLKTNVPDAKGFNLIETTTAVLVIGALAAIATPSLLAWYERQRVKGAMEAVKAVVINARHQAMRNGKACRLKFNSATVEGVLLDVDSVTGVVTELTAPCISTGAVEVNRLSGLQIGAPIQLWAKSQPTSSPPQLTFTFKGTSLNDVEFLIYQANRPASAYGVQVAAGIGIFRVCRYQATQLPPTDLTTANCRTL
ncbi:MAG: prepilin-type N-terminal cleavage/methylation domain-containing protein [Cyanobacteria bacterium P01_F01_bin.42]